ncbi:helix-turn-helix domain-containing protein [Microbispora rosea]|uniref:helix-turn-helix domain-containing protein n=1 Tax=Microbispora rosea TaxID=58117 RepID=UPI0037ACD61E
MAANDRWISAKQLAAILGCSPKHVQRKCTSGEWPSKTVANAYRFPPEYVEQIKALLETQPRSAETAPAPEPRDVPAPTAAPKPRRRTTDLAAPTAAGSSVTPLGPRLVARRRRSA